MRLFRKHNKPKQSNIFPESSDWDQLQSYTKDSNFSNLQPSYDTQYDHRGYPSYEKTNYNSLESLLNNSVIDGDPFTFQGENYILTPEILRQANLEPRHEILIEGVRIGFSDIFHADNRNVAIGYVETPSGEVKVRSYYQSNSSGLWRYLPDYVVNELNEPCWFGKAYTEESITLPFGIQKALNLINSNPPIETNDIYPDFFLFGTAKKYSSKHEYINRSRQNNLVGDFYQEVDNYPKYDFGHLSRDKNPPEQIDVTGPNTPNFHRLLDVSFFNSAIYLNATIELYPALDQTILYSICNIDHPTRAWVGNMETTTEITSTGCRKSWVSMGDIGTPLYEHGEQAGGYEDPDDSRYYYRGMWKNYISKMPIIQRYLYETGK